MSMKTKQSSLNWWKVNTHPPSRQRVKPNRSKNPDERYIESHCWDRLIHILDACHSFHHLGRRSPPWDSNAGLSIRPIRCLSNLHYFLRIWKRCLSFFRRHRFVSYFSQQVSSSFLCISLRNILFFLLFSQKRRAVTCHRFCRSCDFYLECFHERQQRRTVLRCHRNCRSRFASATAFVASNDNQSSSASPFTLSSNGDGGKMHQTYLL